MAWWRERVVAPVRRAWRAVARRARKNRSTGVVDLHRDIQTCGYDDVQVMWNMLSLERQTSGLRPAPEKPRRASFWRPSFWHCASVQRRELRV
ncbi:uncharacterized protein LOC100829102 [Brachypodium distachyon]|uniref:Uncharacterized protein n=1 Tax=Brachypodium distachyon TaxID=15368 RepID=A0A0Q3HJS9_BRADI|nr:uncharacterized protein LOC100829102 [Brachypodium distachyon]KQJ93610.1 hypothetical protein BRADI_3g05703v3 [Brachypodium distachyon]|eukprot:XP_003571004.1 uncharacterized protein LOC100829102 [Brachypodium distachyon]